MTGTCAPPPGTASGTYHVLVRDGEIEPARWSGPSASSPTGYWRLIGVHHPISCGNTSYRYVGQLTHPDEVAVLRSRAINALEILRAILEADERGQGLPFQIAMDNAIALLGGTP